MEYFGQVRSKKQSELVLLCGLWSPAVGDLIYWNCQPRKVCVSQSQQPSSREGHTYGVEILIVSPQQMTLTLDRRITMHKEEYASPSSRQRTQLNETHGNQVTGSILCHFLLVRISRVLHCQRSNTFLFLLYSCCSRKQVFSTFFYLSCLLLYTSHVFPMVHLAVQQNSVPFFGIPLLLPNLLFKKILLHTVVPLTLLFVHVLH